MPRHEHLPEGAQLAAKRRNWSDADTDSLLALFFRLYPQTLAIAANRDLSAFFEREAAEQDARENNPTKNLLIERYDHPGETIFRVIIFETNGHGASSVLDIAESNKLTTMKNWVKENHPEIRHVHIDGNIRQVDDPWLTAVCLMRQPE